MHEYVIARGVVESVRNFSLNFGCGVKRFKVLVGELSMLDIGVLREALEGLIAASEVRGADFSIEIEPARISCGSCGNIISFGEAVSHLSEEEREMIHFLPDLIASYAACRRCGSLDLRIISGRGVSVRDVVFTEG
ncbi:hydrogenase nickel incorporation protein HypA [Candidatus Calditenuaceae archaeon HR02]|nr:hydrogenase nickel incorporation protein HypA [Candidatus Calditenuaceae archaeon HR02]